MNPVLVLFLLFSQIGGAQSPAERAIAEARRTIEKDPAKPDGYNALALALARRARETSDAALYGQGEEAVRRALELDPNNYGALQARTWLLLGQHEFAAARKLASTLNERMPDDLMVYGFLTDANAELGNYDEAEKACNWMLRLRPGNVPALTRASYLRELFGDLDGALELMDMAFQATPRSESEDRAWMLTQMSHLRILAGRLGDAEALASQALAIFPEYHYALAALARVRTGQERFAEAAELLKKRYTAAPHPENLYDLAEALESAGKSRDAEAAYAEFETKALGEAAKADNSNRELIFYYSGRGKQPARALEIARREMQIRQDIYTRDAYAWALHSAGKHAEAREQIEIVLKVGVRDPRIEGHANEIRKAAGAATPLAPDPGTSEN